MASAIRIAVVGVSTLLKAVWLTIGWPFGSLSAVTYSYNNANQPTGITQGTSSVGFTYDGAGRPKTLTLPDGIVQTNGYDDANEVTSISYTKGTTTLGDLAYPYDLAGRRTAVWGTYGRTGLPTATGASASYNANNQLTSWNGTTSSYDLNGNLTDFGSQTFSWNDRNQLSATSAGNSSFAYDGQGRRLSKTVGGTTTKFLYDRANVVQEQNSSNTATANLLTGLGIDQTFSRQVVGGATSNLLTDALGSTIGLGDANGAVQTSYTYEPFGAVTTSGAINTNTYQFTGRENDGATGLYFYRARYYGPTFGRFVSEDPIGFAGSGVNVYVYVGNDPTSLTDALGLEPGSGCSGGLNAGLNLVLIKFEFNIGGSCGLVHASEIGVGLGFPGLSLGGGFEDDVCAGFEGSAGFNLGVVGAGGSLEAGVDAAGGGAWTAGGGATAGPFRTPIQGGAYLTFGDC